MKPLIKKPKINSELQYLLDQEMWLDDEMELDYKPIFLFEDWNDDEIEILSKETGLESELIEGMKFQTILGFHVWSDFFDGGRYSMYPTEDDKEKMDFSTYNDLVKLLNKFYKKILIN